MVAGFSKLAGLLVIVGAVLICPGHGVGHPGSRVTADHSMLHSASGTEENDRLMTIAISVFIASKVPDISLDVIEMIAKSIVEVSQEYDFDPFFITSLIYRESNFNPVSVSSKRALGIMQIIPRFHGLDMSEGFDLNTNMKTGIAHLAGLRERHKDTRHMLIAYYAGERALRRLKVGDVTGEFAQELHLYATRILKDYHVISKSLKRLMSGGMETVSLR